MHFCVQSCVFRVLSCVLSLFPDSVSFRVLQVVRRVHTVCPQVGTACAGKIWAVCPEVAWHVPVKSGHVPVTCFAHFSLSEHFSHFLTFLNMFFHFFNCLDFSFFPPHFFSLLFVFRALTFLFYLSIFPEHDTLPPCLWRMGPLKKIAKHASSSPWT